MRSPEPSPPPYAGIIRAARRPDGWSPTGPAPAGHQGRPELYPQEGEDLCYLTGDWMIFQRQVGHRWSLDDLLTAHYAVVNAPASGVRHALDIGCGIGSVLQMIAWSFPQAECVGVEAQELSFGLAQRSIAFNGVTDRVRLFHADLRHVMIPDPPAEGFDLVTGTPPYIPLGAGTVSNHDQCEPCRFEVRGGIEAYCEAAARWLAPHGRFVVCEGANPHARTLDAARDANLQVLSLQDVIPKQGKGPLFTLFCMAHAAHAPEAELQVQEPLVVRLSDDRRSPEYAEVRRRMGMPP